VPLFYAVLNNAAVVHMMLLMVLPQTAALCACLAALLCPVMCSGESFAHDASTELPGQSDEHHSCAEHACFCSGAPVSPEKPGNLHSFERSVAAVFLPAPMIDSATDLLSSAEAVSFVSSPPALGRILPLLI
jgi:hypothetical protein